MRVRHTILCENGFSVRVYFCTLHLARARTHAYEHTAQGYTHLYLQWV